MAYRILLALTACAALALATGAAAQSDQTPLPAPPSPEGRLFLTNYGPTEYNAPGPNWSVAQNSQGVLYVGNSASGVLSFDGATWTTLELPGRKPVRSLDIDSEDRLYVGGNGELGYFESDIAGRPGFVSLLNQVPEAHRNVGEVWETQVTPDGVFYRLDNVILRWDGTQMDAVSSDDGYHVGAYVEGVHYVREWGEGLRRIESGPDGLRLVTVPGGERFAQTRIYVMLPYGDGRLLIGTAEEGFFLFDGETFTPFRTEADAYFEEHQIYLPGAVLSDGRFAIGTLSGGVVILDRAGRLVHTIDRDAGLMTNTALYPYVDRENALWVGLNGGLARIEASSPLTRFGPEDGISGQVYVIERFRDRLFAGLTTEIVVLDEAAGAFRPVEGDVRETQCFFLLPYGDALLAGCYEGVLRLEGDRLVTIRPSVNRDFVVGTMHQWQRDPDWVFVAVNSGVAALRISGSGDVAEEVWLSREPVTGFGISEEDGRLWLGMNNGAVLRIDIPDGASSGDALRAARAELLGDDHGLPGGSVTPFVVGQRTLFGTLEGYMRWDDAAGRFVVDATFDAGPGAFETMDAVQFVGGQEDTRGRVWLAADNESAVAEPQPDGTFIVQPGPFRRLAARSLTDILIEPDRGLVWIGTDHDLVRYDESAPVTEQIAYKTLIRRVYTAADSLVYGGMGAAPEPRLEFDQNALRFTFAAASFVAPEQTSYRTFLEGFSDDWSGWGSDRTREFTNLPEGRYVFRAQARDVAGRVSEEARFAFSILPPWYRTWWAYGLFALLLGGVLAGGVRSVQLRAAERERARVRALEERSRELERVVSERTGELRQRVEELAVINSVQQGLVAELDMQAIYDLVGDRLRDLFDAQVVVIRTFDLQNELEHYRYVIEKGERLYVGPRPISVFQQHLIREPEPILINEDFLGYMKRIGTRAVTEGEVPRSALFVPLVVGDVVRGNVSLQNVDHEHAFSDADVRLLTTLANSMSVALENARLFDETTQRATELDTVNRVSRALVSQLDFDALVRIVGEQMRETFGADIVYVALHDRETNMLHFPYEYGDETPSRPFGSGLTEKIITTRKPLIINRDMEEMRLRLKTEQIGKVAASYLGVPILTGDEAIGVISVQTTEEENRFDDEDLRLLSTIAANVGVAIQNAEAYRRLNAALKELRSTQAQLVTQEKLASLGQLTAGIAHEIKNPLNFITNFADLNEELASEMADIVRQHRAALPDDLADDLEDLITSVRTNARQIAKHGQRADTIVRNMMEHATAGAGDRYEVGVNGLVDEYINLAYHAKRVQYPDLQVAIERAFDERAGSVEMAPKEIGRVLLNLIGNAVDAVAEARADRDDAYTPTVRVATERRNGRVEIQVSDNGPGVPDAMRDKIFEPFFTTKPTGSGTGLGLSLSYDIVTQGHGGTLSVESTPGEGATFVVAIPAG